MTMLFTILGLFVLCAVAAVGLAQLRDLSVRPDTHIWRPHARSLAAAASGHRHQRFDPSLGST
jgi:hypothetical protein